MLTVIKRQGREEPFNIEKIKTTLAAASDDFGQPLGSGELRNLADGILGQFAGKETVTAKEIFNAVLEALRSQGFGALATFYSESSLNNWKE